jgi:hypothetical protein
MPSKDHANNIRSRIANFDGAGLSLMEYIALPKSAVHTLKVKRHTKYLKLPDELGWYIIKFENPYYDNSIMTIEHNENDTVKTFTDWNFFPNLCYSNKLEFTKPDMFKHYVSYSNYTDFNELVQLYYNDTLKNIPADLDIDEFVKEPNQELLSFLKPDELLYAHHEHKFEHGKDVYLFGKNIITSICDVFECHKISDNYADLIADI